MLSSTYDEPSTTSPSTGTFSPGRTITMSPGRTSPSGTSSVSPSRSHACGLRLQADEPLDRFRGAALRPRLQVPAEQDKGDDDRGRLVIDVLRAWRENAGGERRDHRIPPGGAGTERDERIHVGCAAEQGRHAFAEKAQARPEQHDGGERELQIPALALADRLYDPMRARAESGEHPSRERRQAA